jgi:hypothetical protein
VEQRPDEDSDGCVLFGGVREFLFGGKEEYMHDWVEKMLQHVQSTVPTCLKEFWVTSAPEREFDNWVGWSLGCQCGDDVGRVLGYPLSKIDPEQTRESECYVSPLAFQCSSCNKTTELFDTKLHGFDAEVGGIHVHYHATGDRTAIPCPHCGATKFSVTAFFLHSHFDLFEDQPELEPRTQNFFGWFDCCGLCESCGKETSLANFETA